MDFSGKCNCWEANDIITDGQNCMYPNQRLREYYGVVQNSRLTAVPVVYNKVGVIIYNVHMRLPLPPHTGYIWKEHTDGVFLKRWRYDNHNIFKAALPVSNISGLVSEEYIFLPFLAKPEKHKGMRFEVYPDWFESISLHTTLWNSSVFKFIRNIVDGTLEIQNIC